LLRISLLDKWTHYASAVAAVCATLPGASPGHRASAMAMARPSIEMVGLDSYGVGS
jgi:nitrate reductase delta subunit